jgi:dipeptidyl aminopeptidase/acylaminoacyl peptidase
MLRWSYVPLALVVLTACAPEAGPLPAMPPSAPVASTAAAPAPAPATSGDSSASSYSGHGAASVSPEILAKFAPRPLDPAVKRRIEAMLDVRAPGSGIPSSDGKHLFFTWNVTGTAQVWRLDAPRGYPAQMTGGVDATVVEDVLPDGSAIVVQRDRNGEENPGLYLQKAGGGPLQLIQQKPGVQTEHQFVTDDGRFVYFRSNDVKPSSYAIYRYDVRGGARETVFDQDGIWHVADHRPDGTLLLAKETGGSSAEFFEWDPAKKALRPLFGQGETEDWDARYGAAPGEVIARAPHGSEFYRLWRWKDGTFTAIGPEMKHDVAGFDLDRQKRRILYTVNEEGYQRLRGMDAKTLKPIALPRLPDADNTSFGATSPDGSFTTFSIDGARQPRQSYVHDWRTGKTIAWTAPNTPELDVPHFAVPTLESFPARDGTKIPMFVRRPESCIKSPKPCPVIVVFHGGPEGQSTAGFNGGAQLFVDAGFIRVDPNVRGSSGYGRAWLHADDGAKRLNVITDIEDVAKYVRTAFAVGGVAPKIGIYGGSYGGYSTLVGMTMFAGAYDAGAEIVGISNLVTFIRNTAPYRRLLRATEYGDPDKGDLEALTKLSPMTYLDRVNAPLLLIQGANDPRVPVGEAIQIHDALASRNIDAPLVIFPDEGHGAQKRENVVTQIGDVIAFFEKHLK